MRWGRLRWVALVFVVFGVACTAYITRQLDSVRFSHSVHQKADVNCLTCHEPIYDAKSMSGTFMPKEKKCRECHEERKQGDCDFCHRDGRKPATYLPRPHEIKIGHEKHIELVKEECPRCHATLTEPQRRAPVPTMASCLGCHEHQKEYDDGLCQRCHKDLTRYPLKPLSLFSHQGNFVKGHARQARAASQTCAQCHEQTFCADCHAQTVSTRIEVKLPERADSDFIHRDDFLGRHSIEAKADPTSCLRCHGVSSCENCHTAQNVTSRAQNPRDPHPAGWTVPGSPRFHGEAARRDIVGCASCHDQGPRSNCIECHKVGGTGGNPHPMGWIQRHDRQEIRHNSMCLYCHL